VTALAEWRDARRVLCVRLDSIGDVLMTTPALRAVKESAPDREVVLLTSPSGGRVGRLVPFVDEIIEYDAPWLKATQLRTGPDADHDMIALLRHARVDGAVIFTVFSQSALPAALMCLLAAIPLRAAHARENPYQLLTTWVRDTEPESGIRHEVERQLALAAALGCAPSDSGLALQIPDGARRRARALLGELGIGSDERWVVLHPGATAASRRYPPELFAEAVRRLAETWPHRTLVTGDATEAALIDEVCGRVGARAVNLAGRLDFEVLAATIEAAPLLITNNTGPAHIAAAVGTPVVDLYALTNPQHTPWRATSRVLSHDVACRNCFRSVCPAGHHDCLRKIPPERVTQAALELLSLSQ
jgi:lipopolysaccharide heptosyltransferase II